MVDFGIFVSGMMAGVLLALVLWLAIYWKADDE